MADLGVLPRHVMMAVLDGLLFLTCLLHV
jgi:hypothetical protein